MLNLLCSLLFAPLGLFKTRGRLAAEILALRHQRGVLPRSVKRPQLAKADRGLWVLLSRRWAGWSDALLIVMPASVIRWHRAGFRHDWTWRGQSQGSRPRIDPAIRALIKRMVTVDPWGCRGCRSHLPQAQPVLRQERRLFARPAQATWVVVIAAVCHRLRDFAARAAARATVTLRRLTRLLAGCDSDNLQIGHPAPRVGPPDVAVGVRREVVQATGLSGDVDRTLDDAEGAPWLPPAATYCSCGVSLQPTSTMAANPATNEGSLELQEVGVSVMTDLVRAVHCKSRSSIFLPYGVILALLGPDIDHVVDEWPDAVGVVAEAPV